MASGWQDELDKLIERMKVQTFLDDNQIKTVVYWCIASYGHADLKKFPVFRITGETESGKSDIANIMRDLSHGRNLDQSKQEEMNFVDAKSWTESGIRNHIDELCKNKKGASIILDEADEFPTKFYENFFEKRLSEYRDSGGEKNSQRVQNLYIPVVMTAHLALKQATQQNRTIEIRARLRTFPFESRGRTYNDDEDMPMPYSEGSYVHAGTACQYIAKEIEWDKVNERYKGRRIAQKWAPLRAVAEHLEDEEFLAHIENVFREAERTRQEDRAKEINPQTWNGIVELCYECVEDHETLPFDWRPYAKWNRGDFPNALRLKDIDHQIPDFSDTQIARACEDLGFEKVRSGVTWIRPLSPKRIKEIGDRHGLQNDWIDELAEEEP